MSEDLHAGCSHLPSRHCKNPGKCECWCTFCLLRAAGETIKWAKKRFPREGT